MTFRNIVSVAVLSCVFVLLMGSIGCSTNPDEQRARDEKTRDEVAKATERAKPALQEAGRKIDEAAKDAAHQANAAVQGVRDGLRDSSHPLIDVNSASEDQLRVLPGVDRAQARKIIENRPYGDKHDLLAKGIVSGGTYDKIRDQITAR
jgi:DNA uptake protein ComE-like DNA-binding protein